jgi:hypothetical protein
MRISAILTSPRATAIIFSFVFATLTPSAFGDCRRGTPSGGAFGIDEGRLCSFGESPAPVIPIEGNYNNFDYSTDSLFSNKERRQMLKQIVTRGASRDGRIQQAVSSISRPLGGPSRRTGLVVR